jgi:CubicO group peptidase (beta-lactamase class C family)
VCVYHDGECVVDIWGGVRDRRGTPWAEDTMAPSFSTTKGVAATLMHIMVDRGLLDYDDKVADYWPEFAQAGKERITIRQVLSHQSGLYHIRQMIDDAHRMLDWDHMVRAIEAARPQHNPGERTGYHGLTFGFLVGEILQRITHRRFSQLVYDELVQPLGLDGMYVGAPPEAMARAAELIWPQRSFLHLTAPLEGEPRVATHLLHGGASALQWLLRTAGVQIDFESILDALAPRGISSFDFGSEETLQAAIPAANGLFTARSLARMYAALAGGGQLDGVSLLSARTLRRATKIQPRPHHMMVMPYDMRWRLGYHGVLTSRGVPRRAFGHFGFGGSGAWADPSRDLACGMIVNSGMGTPFGDFRIVRVGGAALQCAQARRRSAVSSRKVTPQRPRRLTGPRPAPRPSVVKLRSSQAASRLPTMAR